MGKLGETRVIDGRKQQTMAHGLNLACHMFQSVQFDWNTDIAHLFTYHLGVSHHHSRVE